MWDTSISISGAVTLHGVVVEIWDPSHIQTQSGVHKIQNNNNFKTVPTPDDVTVS